MGSLFRPKGEPLKDEESVDDTEKKESNIAVEVGISEETNKVKRKVKKKVLVPIPKDKDSNNPSSSSPSASKKKKSKSMIQLSAEGGIIEPPSSSPLSPSTTKKKKSKSIAVPPAPPDDTPKSKSTTPSSKRKKSKSMTAAAASSSEDILHKKSPGSTRRKSTYSGAPEGKKKKASKKSPKTNSSPKKTTTAKKQHDKEDTTEEITGEAAALFEVTKESGGKATIDENGFLIHEEQAVRAPETTDDWSDDGDQKKALRHSLFNTTSGGKHLSPKNSPKVSPLPTSTSSRKSRLDADTVKDMMDEFGDSIDSSMVDFGGDNQKTNSKKEKARPQHDTDRLSKVKEEAIAEFSKPEALESSPQMVAEGTSSSTSADDLQRILLKEQMALKQERESFAFERESIELQLEEERRITESLDAELKDVYAKLETSILDKDEELASLRREIEDLKRVREEDKGDDSAKVAAQEDVIASLREWIELMQPGAMDLIDNMTPGEEKSIDVLQGQLIQTTVKLSGKEAALAAKQAETDKLKEQLEEAQKTSFTWKLKQEIKDLQAAVKESERRRQMENKQALQKLHKKSETIDFLQKQLAEHMSSSSMMETDLSDEEEQRPQRPSFAGIMARVRSPLASPKSGVEEAIAGIENGAPPPLTEEDSEVENEEQDDHSGLSHNGTDQKEESNQTMINEQSHALRKSRFGSSFSGVIAKIRSPIRTPTSGAVNVVSSEGVGTLEGPPLINDEEEYGAGDRREEEANSLENAVPPSPDKEFDPPMGSKSADEIDPPELDQLDQWWEDVGDSSPIEKEESEKATETPHQQNRSERNSTTQVSKKAIVDSV